MSPHLLSTSELNFAIITHLRNHRLLDAVTMFDNSPQLRNTTTYNLLVSGYASNNQLKSALNLFDEMPHRDAVSYNTLLSALARPQPVRAFHLLLRMLRSNVAPTGPTLSTILPSLPDPNLAHQVHAIAIRSSLSSNTFVGSALIAAYTNLNDANSLQQAFRDIQTKNAVTWTALISGLMHLNRVSDARQLFDEMPFTLRTPVTYTALINGYVHNNQLKTARKLFDDPTVDKNVVTWTAMINGYNKIKRFREALELFVQMNRMAHVSPNPFTYSAALTSAAGLACISAGASVHARILKHGWHFSDHVLATCVVEMYGRCGEAGAAVKAFEESEPGTRSVATWNAVIGACGRNGRAYKALELFYRISTERSNGVRADAVTAVNVLTACAHGGLIEEGERVFETMERDLGIERGIEHYGCLIDLYARAGMAAAAEKVVAEMPVAADAAAEAEGLGLGFDRGIRVSGERGEWERMGRLKEERERVVGKKKGRGVSWVESNFGC